MDKKSELALIDMNRQFYQRYAASFSDTRQAPWAGWRTLVEIVRELGIIALGPETKRAKTTGTSGTSRAVGSVRPTRIVDIACGNLRFERFLAAEFPFAPMSFCALDACAELLQTAAQTRFAKDEKHSIVFDVRCADILGALLDGQHIPVTEGTADIVVCFGFMHHVPGEMLRQTLMREFVRACRPGGIIAVSFWQFMNTEQLAKKARKADIFGKKNLARKGIDPGALEEGDHFLSWQASFETLRYCHHFSEAEIDRLSSFLEPDVGELARYSRDGPDKKANRYLVFRR